MLLAATRPAALEVVCDANGFIANFWRAVRHQPDKVAEWTDYPVSHVDIGARHRWLMGRRDFLNEVLQDCDWPGDSKIAGWWLYGQCSWIGSGWCDWSAAPAGARKPMGQVPRVSNAGMGVQAIGRIPRVSDAGVGYDALLTSAGRAAWMWLHQLSDRLERVRVIHGDWTRCLNHRFGGDDTAVFLDPPYKAYEALYGVTEPVASAVEGWAREHPHLRVALCGHQGDYELPGWDAVEWSRGRLTYGGGKTTDQECIWYSPACRPRVISDLFA